MNKKQIFDFIVNKTASVCNVSADEIKGGCRRADVVDARCMAYRLAIQDYGFTPRDIATLLGRGDLKAIRVLYHTYDARCRSFCFRELSASLRTEILRGGVLSAE